MSEPFTCPICRTPGATQVAEEVDIGVGTQTFVTGIECPKCGQIPVCAMCGALNGKHHKWCRSMMDAWEKGFA